MDGSDWLESQPDLVECKSGGRITLRSCKRRQKVRAHYETWKALDEHIAATFRMCVDCEHWDQKPKRNRKLTRNEILDQIFPQRSDNRKKREKREQSTSDK